MTTTTIPGTIHIRPRRFAGVLVGVAALAATATWAVDGRSTETHANVRTGTAVLSSLNPAERRYVEGIEAASPLELAAAYGTSPVDALGLTTSARQHVDAIRALTPTQLAATYGAGVVASLTPSARAYVEAIMAMSPEELAASF